MARWSVVDKSRMITAKILVTPDQGYLDYEHQNSSQTSQVLSEVHRAQKQFRYHLVTTWTTMMPLCVVNRAKNLTLTIVLSGKPRLTDCRAAQLAGVSATGKVAWRSTPWL